MGTDAAGEDPRDILHRFERALCGLVIVLDQQRADESLPAGDIAALLDILHGFMAPAVEGIQDYVPRGHGLAA